jgi:hypothetical protein
MGGGGRRTSVYHCPYCKSADIEGEEDSWEGDEVFLYVKCNDCSSKWRETFRYVKWEPVEKEEVEA